LDRPEVLRLFHDQHGVAARRQILQLGPSRRTIERCRATGLVADVLPGVLRLAGAADTFESRAMAVQLHSAPDGVLSAFTAGRLWGLRRMPEHSIWVTVPTHHRDTVPHWVRRSYSNWLHDADVGEYRGFRVQRPLRMLFALAHECNDHLFARAIEDAWHLELMTPPDVSEYLAEARRSGRSGVARMERWLWQTRARTRPSQSHFELQVLDAIRAAGLPEPERQHPLRLRSGETIHLDFAWPPLQLAVEPGHSWFHGGDLQMRKDAARDRACAELGWQVLRYDETAREDLAGVGAEISRVYQARMP
jgi:very-short-patch-repair endonuclease